MTKPKFRAVTHAICQLAECGETYKIVSDQQKCCCRRHQRVLWERENREEYLAKKRVYAELHKERDSTKRRAKYRDDPEFREKIISSIYASRHENPEHHKAIQAKFRAKPEEREKARQKSQAWHTANAERANKRRLLRMKSQNKKSPWMVLIGSAKLRAEKRGLPFDLTYEWGEARWTGRCELTNLEFVIRKGGGALGPRSFSPSIDRIKPSLGYVQGNCRFVLWPINTFKYDGDDETMYLMAEALLADRKRRMG